MFPSSILYLKASTERSRIMTRSVTPKNIMNQNNDVEMEVSAESFLYFLSAGSGTLRVLVLKQILIGT